MSAGFDLAGERERLAGLDPAEIAAYVSIALEVLTDIVQERGMTGDQLRDERHRILSEELDEIKKEQDELDGEGARD